VFLKSLTLRGFKSFADKTLLEFEPGITVIVGPNGSGKSNIVDALTWVLGTHSAKSLRGGSMADVIFAGSAGKPPLGRAAVEMTIDNSSGTLPIEFSEVAVGRSMFSSGENSYQINDVDCRALDVQELLSDTGLGRENHTIVGQGQLDAVLNARPEDRRALIEEAAGILKHRRRKERALRKLAQMDAHVERLADVLRELRRNLRPLERQAEAAAKYAELQTALREVRLLRALRELAGLQARSEGDRSLLAASDARLAQLDAACADARRAEAEVEATLSRLSPEAHRAGQTHFSLANLVERWRGLTERIEERRSGLIEAVEEPVAGRDPEELRMRAGQERERLDVLEADLQRARGRLDQAASARQAAEQARRAHEQAAAAEARRRAEARERQLRWEGEVAAARSRLAQAASEEGRLASQLSGLGLRSQQLSEHSAAARAQLDRLEVDCAGFAESLAKARDVLAERAAVLASAAAAERELERRRASLGARAEALRAASEEPGGAAAAVLEAVERGEMEGVCGPLVGSLRVEPGMAQAVAAALGPLGDALVVTGAAAARDAIGFVRSRSSGRVLLLAGNGTAEHAGLPAEDDGPEGARPVVTALRAEAGVQTALAQALADTYLADDLEVAAGLAQRHPTGVFVTRDGEVAGARGWAGGAAGAASAVVTRAAAEEAERELAVVGEELADASRDLAAAEAERESAEQVLAAATAALRDAEAQAAAAGERGKRLEEERASAQRELAVVQQQVDALAAEISQQRRRLGELEARGAAHVDEHRGAEAEQGPDLEAERLEDALSEAREEEVQARLDAGAVEQRGAETARRAKGLEREAHDVEQRLAERERRRVRRLAAIARCEQLAALARTALQQAEASLALAAAERDRLEEQRAEQQRELGVVRARIRAVEADLGAIKEERHGSELRRQELHMALDAVRGRLTEELGVDPDSAFAAAAPETFEGGAARDTELAEREDGLLRKSALLGTVNPLALEEFTALQERHEFLTAQLEDLRQSKRDLLQVVEAVDGRIQEVFGAAFADVAAQFERIFPRLFPGGEGRLVLTDPQNLLETGVDVEARPPGKRVKRLSLLSGGERSLTALAVLFSIFAARPSPFYVLDEVEAALDDLNLQRFLEVVKDFRGSSQLLIVTHQKRTMEVADALYGVTMQRDGVSRVIGQRFEPHDPQPTSAEQAERVGA